MPEYMEQRRMRLAELIPRGESEGFFVQWPSETKGQFAQRLFSKGPDENGEVLDYMAVILKGDSVSPIFVARRGGECFLVDGWRRCLAAALCERTTISAVIFDVASQKDEDSIRELALELKSDGVHWTGIVQLIKAQLMLFAAANTV